MSDCKAYREEIFEASDGGGLSRGARAHAQACGACGEELRGRESLKALVRGLGRVEAPADFDFRLRSRMARADAAPRRGPFRGLRLVYALAPVAAAACLLFVAASLYFRPDARTDAPPAVAASRPARTDAPAPPAPAPGVEKVGGVNGTAGVGVEVATATTHARPSPPAARRQRAAASQRPTTEVASKSEARAGGERNTTLASFGSAPVIKGQGVTIALRAPGEPLRMILRDERGAGRVVPMRSVSFGSQAPIVREGAPRRSPAADDEGVW
ncbi:MAG TPA: hypothetical protein VF668_18695 [Pyrinomonadaceae bacterium]|jgi:hypothetical protein